MTVAIAGAQTRAGIRVASTFGTAVACGALHQLAAEISMSPNQQVIEGRAIGSGRFMADNYIRGSISPTVSVTGDCGYGNNFDTIAALILGTDTVSAVAGAEPNDHLHRLTFNTTLNAKYATIAYESSTSTVHEFPSCACQSLTIRTTSVPGLLEYAAEFLANDISLSSVINTNVTLANVTARDTELVAVDFDDDFWVNAQGGAALAGANQYNITSLEFVLTRPQEFRGEIKGSAGNSAPVSTGNATATFAIVAKELKDHTYYTVWSTQVAQKASAVFEGSQIGTGGFRTVGIYLPRIQLTEPPQYGPTDPGVNTVSMNFNCAVASANPTSMNSTYPYLEIINTLSTSLLA